MTDTHPKKRAILEAALAEFREHGFQAANMDRIAARAPASKRTVYKHFASKQALFEEISALLVERTAEASERPYRAAEGIRDGLEQIARNLVDLYLDPEFLDTVRMMLAECFRSPEAARDVWERAHSGEDGLTRWLRQATKDGRLAVSDPVAAATQLTGMLKAFTFWEQVIAPSRALPNQAERQAIVSDSVKTFLARYGEAPTGF
ncbi:MAG: TetR/AcrR family transcriptional regulator [Acidobacteriota bacterium]